MLVLSRRKNEAVKIGDLVTVVVVEVLGDKVRLGFEAPPEVCIDRQEVYNAKRDGRPIRMVRKKEIAPKPKSKWGVQ